MESNILTKIPSTIIISNLLHKLDTKKQDSMPTCLTTTLFFPLLFNYVNQQNISHLKKMCSDIDPPSTDQQNFEQGTTHDSVSKVQSQYRESKIKISRRKMFVRH